jgi:Cupredoxin-like domain
MRRITYTLAATLACALTAQAETSEFTIAIKNHRFDPPVVTVPANTKVKLVIENQDPTPEEFESHDLNREKVVAGGAKASIWVGPLTPGTYIFFGEFHPDTASGTLVAK